MPLQYKPDIGCIVMCNFDKAFKKPEMVKPRPAIIIAPPAAARPNLCIIVPLSTNKPQKIMPYHLEINLPFVLPTPFNKAKAWIKANMIYVAGFHRLSLFRTGKIINGKRQYFTKAIDKFTLQNIRKAILHGLGMGYMIHHV